jgi:enoyl-CoA hydratase
MPLLKAVNSDNICVVTISRPEALNALNIETIQGLGKVMEDIAENNDIKAVILTGDGDKAFVAGADIRELSILEEMEAFALSDRGQKIFKQIEDSPKPIIAAVNGFALGGGLELAMACHIRLATPNAKFGQPEINLGILPGYGGTQRLAQLVGRGKALELLLTADMVSADEAKELGLVNHIYASREEMMEAAIAMLRKITTKSPIAIANIIKTVNAGFDFEKQGYAEEAKAFARCSSTEDFKEGTTAFLEKRKAVFKGF